MYIYIYMYTYRQMQLDDFERRSVAADATCPDHALCMMLRIAEIFWGGLQSSFGIGVNGALHGPVLRYTPNQKTLPRGSGIARGLQWFGAVNCAAWA